MIIYKNVELKARVVTSVKKNQYIELLIKKTLSMKLWKALSRRGIIQKAHYT